jgi:hypothetical protein
MVIPDKDNGTDFTSNIILPQLGPHLVQTHAGLFALASTRTRTRVPFL